MGIRVWRRLPVGLTFVDFIGDNSDAFGAWACDDGEVGFSEKKTGNFTDMDLRRTRVGCILVCVALLDDVLGLVIAGIIPQAESEVVPTYGTYGRASGSQPPWSLLDLSSTSTSITVMIPQPPMRTTIQRQLSPSTPCPQFFLVAIVLTLMAFVADSGYAGTSELFGAYLAGALVGYVFGKEDVANGGEDKPSGEVSGLVDAIIAPPMRPTR
ncbi:hypothetical protein BDZ97DRAFT_1928857 [Flammula alnicola]|nr:hypothetical protein BDZ97DRAFT_1928857 [Flammula alnicola]